jgi:hypothetical protein
MKVGRVVRLSILFLGLGFAGAAVRYWRWWPSHTTAFSIASRTACPVCPHTDGLGTDLYKFVTRTLFGGVLNAIPALVIGWMAVACRHTEARETGMESR